MDMPAVFLVVKHVEGSTFGRADEHVVAADAVNEVTHDLEVLILERVRPCCWHERLVARLQIELTQHGAISAPGIVDILALDQNDLAVRDRRGLVPDVLGLLALQERGVGAVGQHRCSAIAGHGSRRDLRRDGGLGEPAPHARGVDAGAEEDEDDEDEPRHMLHD